MRCRLYNLKMNPEKCVFGVFLGFIVHHSAKTRAMITSPAPSSKKELKSFLGKLSYIRRFIPGLSALTGVFAPLLKQDVKFVWSNECKEAYDKVKQLLARLPTMRAPLPGVPLKIYLASTSTAIGALLAQDDGSGEEQAVSFVSRQLQGAETRYPRTERLCLALVYAAQRLRHYFQAHKLHLMVKTDLVRYLLTKPVLTGRLARWLLQLSEFDITCITPKAIKGQALIDMLALFPEDDESILSKEVPGELPEVSTMLAQEKLWTLHFDGSATSAGGGAGIVLTSPDGVTTALSFKLNFPCTNNVAEYEALIIGLLTAQDMGVRDLRIFGDSNLVLSQLKGDFALKEAALAPYRTTAESLIGSFDHITMEHTRGTTNRYADALATLGSKLSFIQGEPRISVLQRDMPATEIVAMPKQCQEEDWMQGIEKGLSGNDIKVSREYVMLFGTLYKRLPSGILSRCIGKRESQERLQEMHESTCGLDQAISLYRRLQRKGYYWPNMKAQAAQLQATCPHCSKVPSVEEVFTLTVSEDWRAPYLMYFIERKLPTNAKQAHRLKRAARRYFMDGGTLFKKGYNGEPLICLSPEESLKVLQEVHAGECGEHQGRRKLYRLLLNMGYFWPTMQEDAKATVKKCRACQIHGNLNHKPHTLLQDMRTPWPFHTWWLDLIGIIHPGSHGYVWILVGTESYTKWVEAIPLRKATGAAVANFIREHIVCRFGIPYKIVTDNRTPFVNKQVSDTLKGYGIKHRCSTPYYPQGNGQAEATNKTLLRILSKMVYEYSGGWSDHLCDTLWAYRTSPRSATGFSPYSLVYGSEAISPAEVAVPTARVAVVNDIEWDASSCADWRWTDLEGVEEKRAEAERRIALYHKRVT